MQIEWKENEAKTEATAEVGRLHLHIHTYVVGTWGWSWSVVDASSNKGHSGLAETREQAVEVAAAWAELIQAIIATAPQSEVNQKCANAYEVDPETCSLTGADIMRTVALLQDAFCPRHPIVKALEFDWRLPGAGGLSKGLVGHCSMDGEALVYRCAYYADSSAVTNEQWIQVEPYKGGVLLTGQLEDGCRIHREVCRVSMQAALDRLLAAWQQRKIFNVSAMVDAIMDHAKPYCPTIPRGAVASSCMEAGTVRH